MLVKFRSDSVISGRGFKATIEYKPRGIGTWSFCSTSNLCNVDEGNCGSDTSWNSAWQVSGDYECTGALRCGNDNCPPQLELAPWVDCCYQPKWQRCQDSLDLKKGTISSPYYPNYYDAFQECTWSIHVPENYTITLKFNAISVSYETRGNYHVCFNDLKILYCRLHDKLTSKFMMEIPHGMNFWFVSIIVHNI